MGAGGAPQRGPLTWSLARRGRRPQTDSTVSAPCLLLLSLLSATQTPGADGETEEGGEERETGRRGGWWANEHNEETDTDYPDPPPPFIFGYGSLYSLRAGCCPLLLSPV